MKLKEFIKILQDEKRISQMETIDALCDDPHVKRVWFEYHEEVK